MKKILVVMGTRPEAIKLAPVIRSLRRQKGLKTYICATAQHRELLDQALAPFRLTPDFDLNLMRRGQSPNAVAKRILKRLDPLLVRLKPDMVIVQGDTTTAASAAVCAAQRRIPVAHVEAGLRSFDFKDPYPEELNRVLIDSISSLLFPPTPAARENLAAEKIRGRSVLMTGNTVVDALRQAGSAATPRSASRNVEVLITLHRREILGAPLKKIFRSLLKLVNRHENLLFVYPVHPNPLIRKTAKRLLQHPRIRLLPPQPYPAMLALLKNSSFLITDSGGLQEEALCLHKPLLVVREKTERPEVVSSGAGVLVGLNPSRLSLWTGRLLTDARVRRRMSRARNPYGDGRAADRIAASVSHWFGLSPRPKEWNP